MWTFVLWVAIMVGIVTGGCGFILWAGKKIVKKEREMENNETINNGRTD